MTWSYVTRVQYSALAVANATDTSATLGLNTVTLNVGDLGVFSINGLALTGVSDSKGNTWRVNTSSGTLGLATSQMNIALTPSIDTLTITFLPPGVSTAYSWALDVFRSSTQYALALDGIAPPITGVGTALTAGPTPTPSNLGDLSIAVFGWYGIQTLSTLTPGYTGVSLSGSAHPTLYFAYDLSVSSPQTITAVTSAAGSWTGLAAQYREVKPTVASAVPSLVNKVPAPPAPVLCDFGWWYGSSHQEVNELTYMVNGQTYPPGATVTSGSTTLPAGTISVASTASFESSGTIMVGALGGGGLPQPVVYTGTTGTTFTGCTGGSGTFASGTPVWDPRFYTNQTLLNQTIWFDAVDSIPLGLPKTSVPSGTNIVSYQWTFGNGQTGSGPTVSTTYTYPMAAPNASVSLTVVDSHNRSYSVAKQIDLSATGAIRFGSGYQVRSGTARS